jgi:large subunit ribosomal protein L19
MGNHALIEEIEEEALKKDLPEFNVGDTIRVSTKIIEGEKERIQVFQGTVIARKGKGLSETVSLHRVSYGEGMERVFNIHSPRIVKIEVVKKGDVRRSKLYYLRGTTGKAAKVQEKIGDSKKKGTFRKKEMTSTIANEEMNVITEPEIVNAQEIAENTSQR